MAAPAKGLPTVPGAPQTPRSYQQMPPMGMPMSGAPHAPKSYQQMGQLPPAGVSMVPGNYGKGSYP